MKLMNVYDEATNEVVGSVPYYDGNEIEEMVEKAYAAQPAWEKVPIFERARILYKFCNLVAEHAPELATILAKELGKPYKQALVEALSSAEIGKENIERAKHVYGEVFNDNADAYHHSVIFTRREALGVIAAIIPFNYPIELTIQKAVPALVMGNSVIVKASTTTPLAVKKIVDLAHEAGIPKDLIHFVTGSRKDCTEHILQNPKVACLALTGSTDAGSEMIRCSADTIKKVILELGGNDALIVREDVADDHEYLSIAAYAIVGGRVFENNGQVCASPKRILVHRKVKDQLIKYITSYIAALRRGHASDPDTDISRLVSVKAAEKVEAQVKLTVEQGAKIILGGNRDGAIFEATVLDDVTPDMDIAKDMEIFGPVIPLITFDTDEEALEIANSSKYGLSSSVITRDFYKAYYFMENIEASACVWNATSAERHHEQPFGGCKASGIGNEGACCSVEEYSRLKTYNLHGVSPKADRLEEDENSAANIYGEAEKLALAAMESAGRDLGLIS